MSDLSARREPGSHLAAPLRRDSDVVKTGLITPAEPQWPGIDPDATDDYAKHLQQVLDGLRALDTRAGDEEGQHR